MNPLRLIQDTLKHRTARKEIYAALKRMRPRGAELPRDEEVEHVIARLLVERPELTAVRTEQTITIYFREDLDPTINPETREMLDSAGFILTKDKVTNRD